MEFNELSDHQICNHFEGIHQLTTKQGFCDLSKELHHQAVDGQDITPRCYNLGDPIHRDEFIDDFRVNAAIIILKYYVAGRVAHVLQSPKLSNNANSLSMMDPFTPEVASTIPPILSASSTVRCSATQQATVNGENSNPSSTTKNSHPLTGGNPLQSMILDASSHLFKNVLFALNWQLRIKYYGEWPEVDISKHFKDKTSSLTDGEWHEILCKSYELIATIPREDDFVMMNCLFGNFPIPKHTNIKQQLHHGMTAFDRKLIDLLQKLEQCYPQFYQDGYRNIWIVKSPDTSCGIGMKLAYRLDEIFELERKMTGRIVQKYLEIPMLAPIHPQLTNYLHHQMIMLQSFTMSSSSSLSPLSSPISHDHRRHQQRQAAFNKMLKNAKYSKFDLRIWVLVTNFQSNPIQAYIYPTLYGRRCGSEYSGDVSTLNDHLIHLTNYTLQKKSVPMQHDSMNAEQDRISASSGSAKERNSNRSSAKKLRGVCKDARYGASSAVASNHTNKSDGDLLISKNFMVFYDSSFHST